MDEKTLNYVIETFKGVYNMGTSFVVPSGWVREHDKVVFETLLERMWELFLNDNVEAQDIRNFIKGNWLVQYRFRYYENGEGINIYITPGEDKRAILSQPEWIEDFLPIKLLKEDDVELPIHKYIKLLGDE